MRLLAKAASAAIFSAAFLAAEPSCSLATLRGTYGYATSGNAIINQELHFFATAGRIKFDGAGNLTAKDQASNGQTQQRVYGGTYTLGPTAAERPS